MNEPVYVDLMRGLDPRFSKTPTPDTGNTASESVRSIPPGDVERPGTSTPANFEIRTNPSILTNRSDWDGTLPSTTLQPYRVSIRITQAKADGYEFESCRRLTLDCVDIIQQSRMLADAIEDALGTIHEGDGAITSLFVGILPQEAK